jgi:protease-4
MTFFKTFLATVLGFFVSFFLVTLILVSITVGFIAAAGSDDVRSIADGSLVRMNLSGSIPEYTRGSLRTILKSGDEPLFADYLRALERIKSDSRIKGIDLHIEGFSGSWPQASELRRKLEEVRKAGKFVVASSGVHGFDEREYYLASAADSIVMEPSAALEINGIAASLLFFKPMLDRLGVKPEILKVGRYKSAVEPFLLDSASEENKVMTRSLVTGLFAEFLTAVQSSRRIAAPTLQRIVDSAAILSADDARRAGLVDTIMYGNELEEMLRRLSGQKTKRRLDAIDIDDYIRQELKSDYVGDGQVAIVYAVGTIVAGEGGGSSPNPLGEGESIGSETFIEAMRTARESEMVKSVVLRIDSPGGDAAASEAMWHEVVLTARKKPVVVSMGGYAASGGYYIAAGADTIVAEPSTLTGSIGVFALRFNTAQLMREKLGINMQSITSSPHADMMSSFRSPDELERRVLAGRTDSIYAEFTRVVAEGRGLTPDSVESLAQGRVWTGREAKANGLVDILGGIEDAIRIAAERGGLKKGSYSLRILPRQQSFAEKIAEIFSQASAALGGSLESRLYENIITRLEQTSGVQALMPPMRID